MEIKIIDEDFSVCKVRDLKQVNTEEDFCFTAKTDEELSLVCKTQCVPDDTLSREDGWKAFRIEGELDFSLIGILAKISGLLARERIGIFVISTYNTDYVLTKKADFDQAIQALEKNGYMMKR